MRTKKEYKKEEKIGECFFIKEMSPIVFEKTNTSNTKSTKRVALFECICGKKFKCIISDIKSGNTKSCGCLRDAKIQQQGLKNKIHGRRNHPLYRMWQGMLRRCNNVQDGAYFNYGGRGIKVCDRWLNIDNFIEDMYPSYKLGLDIDRKNNDGNYNKINCRWATRKQNMNNTRRNRHVKYKGETKTVSEWSDILKISYKTLIYRLNNWNVEKAFTLKLQNNGMVR